jgi:PleD family two-component response regulator
MLYLSEFRNEEIALAAESAVGELERLRSEVARLQSLVEQLDGLAHRDPLVDLPNRRAFIATLQTLIARVERYGYPAAMLFVDVD